MKRLTCFRYGPVAESIAMSTRTKSTTLDFDAAFTLPGIPDMLPPGTYRVDTDEEAVDGLSWTAYRTVATYLHLPSKQEAALPRQIVEIDPAALEAVLQKDKAAS